DEASCADYRLGIGDILNSVVTCENLMTGLGSGGFAITDFFFSPELQQVSETSKLSGILNSFIGDSWGYDKFKGFELW
ncbi:hypothetical protein U1Q18_019524, partial [Sarracenia purpurea var. burkii]